MPSPSGGIIDVCTEFGSYFLLDPSIKSMAMKFLPLATYYANIIDFIEKSSQFELGRCFHYLGEAMRSIIHVLDFNCRNIIL